LFYYGEDVSGFPQMVTTTTVEQVFILVYFLPDIYCLTKIFLWSITSFKQYTRLYQNCSQISQKCIDYKKVLCYERLKTINNAAFRAKRPTTTHISCMMKKY